VLPKAGRPVSVQERKTTFDGTFPALVSRLNVTPLSPPLVVKPTSIWVRVRAVPDVKVIAVEADPIPEAVPVTNQAAPEL
jgi:hypothetical protein